MKKHRYLIVGQGLSGTLLAHQLEENNISYKIIDSGINNSSTKAAGIINPIVFRRTTKSWLIDACLPVAIKKYRALEEKLNTKFFFERKIRRAFSSEQERKTWNKKSTTVEYRDYLTKIEDEVNNAPPFLKQPFGNALVQQVYYVEAMDFVAANRKYFKEKGNLLCERFNYDIATQLPYTIGENTFEQIIFCEGYEGLKNPFFNYLPLTQTKGQLISVQLDGAVHSTEIFNRKCFLLPLENGLYKAGSTYEWDNNTLNTTEIAKDEISDHINHLVDLPYKIIGQEAGIRPTVVDRRPLIGRHPTHKNLFIFNGFGAKGYLLAPYFAQHFYQHIEKAEPLNTEVAIMRFEKNKEKK